MKRQQFHRRRTSRKLILTIDEENTAVLYYLQCKSCSNEEAEALIRVDGLDECYCPACDSEWVAPPPNDWMDKDFDVDEMRYV